MITGLDYCTRSKARGVPLVPRLRYVALQEITRGSDSEWADREVGQEDWAKADAARLAPSKQRLGGDAGTVRTRPQGYSSDLRSAERCETQIGLGGREREGILLR
jgi:hypothetical protein